MNCPYKANTYLAKRIWYKMDVGIEQLDRGERVDGKAAIERLLEKNYLELIG